MSSGTPAAAAAGPGVGDEAPDFTLTDADGQPVTLSAFRSRKAVVVLFYPLTFTSVCQSELCSLNDRLAAVENDDVTTLAVSVDSPAAHRVWAEQQGFGFRLLSDFWPHGEVAQRYGVLDPDLGVARRGTFLVDTDGVVRYRVVKPVPEARDAEELTAAVAALAG